MAASDVSIGRAVRAARGAMSQTELANLMRAEGHRWVQQTVVAIEKGGRSLRLAEALDLARVLRVPVAELEDDPGGRISILRGRARTLMDADQAFGDAGRALITARWSVMQFLDETYPPDESGQIPLDGWGPDEEHDAVSTVSALVWDLDLVRLSKAIYAGELTSGRDYPTWRLTALRDAMVQALGIRSDGVD